MSNNVYAGVDVGGTNIKIGLLDDQGNVLARCSFATRQERGAEAALQQVTQAVGDLLRDSDLDPDGLLAVGLVVPGPLDIPAGRVLTPFNLPGWGDFNVRDRLAELTGRPVMFANDAGAAAYGEYWIGGGQPYDSLVLITLGTGIGGGIIVDGRSIVGSHSMGAEIGHIMVDIGANARRCSCGRTGHLEAYASASGLIARANERLQAGGTSRLLDRATSTGRLTGLTIAQAASDGDPLALELVDETARYLGIGIASVAQIIDPQAVLLGGAMNFGGNASPLGCRFLEQIQSECRNCSLPTIGQQLTIQYAMLGSDAGFVGAAGMARTEFNCTASPSNLRTAAPEHP